MHSSSSVLLRRDRDDAFDTLEAREIQRANNDPLRDVLVFAATNHKLFTTGAERSIVSVYRALWSLIYESPKFGTKCLCVNNTAADCTTGGRTVHTVYSAATFAWRVHGGIVSRFAYSSFARPKTVTTGETDIAAAETTTIADRIVTTTTINRLAVATHGVSGGDGCITAVSTRVQPSIDSALTVARLNDYPYTGKFRSAIVTSEWLCDVSIAWSSLRQDDVPGGGAVKLLDHRFTSPAQVWSLIFDIMDWCETVYAALDMYPVRRSVWDLLVFPDDATIYRYTGATTGGDGDLPIVASACGLVDIGDVCAYAYTLRILMLIVYLSCSYGGMSRAASINDRVSNRAHRCVFPAKTSGVYHALFHTSVLPHRLFCATKTAATRRGAATTPSTAATVVSDKARAVTEAKRWLVRFDSLCASAAARFHLYRPRRDKTVYDCYEEEDNDEVFDSDDTN